MITKKTFIFLSLGLIFSFIAIPSAVWAHCEIPCGIYGDKLRFELLREHIATIEKSARKIRELASKKDAQSKQQLVRWVVNKELHAKKFQKIIFQYFLTQRIKPVKADKKATYEKYLQKLELLHKLAFYAMKAKQTADSKPVEKLRKCLNKFEKLYFSGKKHEHKHGHK